jgi:hypothetical protein
MSLTSKGRCTDESCRTASSMGKAHKSFGKSARFRLWLPARALESRFHDRRSNLQGLLRLWRRFRLLTDEHGNGAPPGNASGFETVAHTANLSFSDDFPLSQNAPWSSSIQATKVPDRFASTLQLYAGRSLRGSFFRQPAHHPPNSLQAPAPACPPAVPQAIPGPQAFPDE